MPKAAARGNVSGLCESKMLGMSGRTSPSMPRSREDGSPGGRVALVVDADQIETLTEPGQFHTLLPQHVHAVARKERLSLCFHPAHRSWLP